MKFTVKTLPRAEADIRQIFRYIHGRSRPGAAAWLNALDWTRQRLRENANSYGEADENEHFQIELKQALFRTRKGRVYRLVFTIVENEVRIL
ncbi:type II toxin-antitoxin system RelE/ParE family toxin, partial [bacterium]|nr:type II toxin-antitoxin system RelE/ParE family toxin [bacterium]